MFKKSIILIVILVLSLFAMEKPTTIEFFSKDSLKITADLYIQNKDKATPFILLFHQAHWSRGEYIETAPKLNKLGFNCMAIDQRSGGSVNDVMNETFKRAEARKLSTDYIDAYPDFLAAIDYVKNHYPKSKLIISGSSYSSALVLHIAGEREDIDGVMAFSPGEYFGKFGKPDNWIEESAKNISVPVFITSAKGEKSYWESIFKSIKSKDKVKFLPETDGNHGSRALWSEFEDSEEYWKTVRKFLRKFNNSVNQE